MDRYLAFLVLPGHDEQLRIFDLGEAVEIDDSVSAFRAAVTLGSGRGLGAVRQGRSESEFIAAGHVLRSLIFDRIWPLLRNCTKLFIAPDGDISRVPFEALPSTEGRFLIDDYQFIYLSAGRDLLRFRDKRREPSTDSVVLGDPDFDLLSTSDQGLQSEKACSASGATREDSHRFAPLPGTRAEAQQIAELLGVEPLLGAAALEGTVKQCHSPAILHIATHGFFFEAMAGRDTVRLGNSVSVRPGPGSMRVGRIALRENAMVRSGVALAGANTWFASGPLPTEAEDGLLTAQDVTGLDLLGTELVVLSACDTGLGHVETGEGVLGLRRAFLMAGAKTVVMSLWKVPDEETQALMCDFYRRLLAGESRAEALRFAELAMKQKGASPFCWAGFLCHGDPSPVPPRAPIQ